MDGIVYLATATVPAEDPGKLQLLQVASIKLKLGHTSIPNRGPSFKLWTFGVPTSVFYLLLKIYKKMSQSAVNSSNFVLKYLKFPDFPRISG